MGSDTQPDIAVIGAGVIGLSSAYKIYQDIPKCKMTVFYEKCSPNTTADGAAGVIFPYLCDGEEAHSWFLQTMDYLSHLYKQDNAFEIGVNPLSGYRFGDRNDAHLKPFFPNYEQVSEKEKKALSLEEKTQKVTTWSLDCTKYLPWLTKNLKELGVLFENRLVNDFEELKDFDMIVNCTGIGAKYLTGDQVLEPVRGQVILVKAPWIRTFYSGHGYHIFPRLLDVVLGGIAQRGNYNLEVDADDNNKIWEGCCKLCPSVKYSEIIEKRVGLRPARDSVRLEIEEKSFDGKKVAILHHYGHGGSGITVHWGCAVAASNVAKQYFSENNFKNIHL